MKPRTKNTLKSIEILLAEPQANLRQAIRGALHREGYVTTSDFSKLDALEDATVMGMPDLIVLDSSMRSERRTKGALEYIRGVRTGTIGSNPFVPIIVMLWEPKKEDVTQFAMAGPDDMLVKPLAPATLLERIETIATDRKRFFVTPDYIGPDRRKDGRSEKEKAAIEGVEVPNTLKRKVMGTPMSKEELAAEISSVRRMIDSLRVERNAVYIEQLITGIAMPLIMGKRPNDMTRKIRSVLDCIDDCRGRLDEEGYPHTANLCGGLATLVNRITDKLDDGPDRKDIELLIPVSKAIVSSVGDDQDKQMFAQEISNMLDRKLKP